MLKFYNTLTRQKEEFKPINKGVASVYSCGPTVYWFAHVGNMRSFLLADILRRILKLNGFDVKSVMNITDVGHLTDDGDDGEDKMLVAMRREGKTAYEIAEFYASAFMTDLEKLNIEPADVYPRATEHIVHQINMITELEEKGFTYETHDGVYFDTSKLSDYGKLSGQKADEKKAGARVEMGGKKNATDFALWKFSPKDSKRDMEWESPWGVGFPGWHLECSAMSVEYLGAPFDIHTGGIDHIAVHHENEIAQTRGSKGVLQANIWMHNEFLTVDGGKMSKSLGNLFTVSDLVEKGYDPLVYRYFFLGAHYRSIQNFTFEALDAARNALQKIRKTVAGWDEPGEVSETFETQFIEAINDDLNTPQALAVMWELIDSNEHSSVKAATLLRFDEVFGLNLDEVVAKPVDVPDKVMNLVGERQRVREEKDWAKSDELRDKIAVLGYGVEDLPDGPKVHVL